MAASFNFPKLPDDIIYYVMTDFLDMVDLARLDTAMCQRKKKLRTEHLTALGSFLLYPGYLPTGKGGNLQYLNWLALRNISVESIKLLGQEKMSGKKEDFVLARKYMPTPKVFHRLQRLDVSGATELPNWFLHRLVAACPALSTLDCAGCTQLVDKCLLDSAKLSYVTLRCLNLLGCRRLTEDGLVSTALVCSGLREVSLGGTDCDAAVTDNVLACLARHCAGLRSVVLHGGAITGVGLGCLLASAVAPQLHTLHLVDCADVCTTPDWAVHWTDASGSSSSSSGSSGGGGGSKGGGGSGVGNSYKTSNSNNSSPNGLRLLLLSSLSLSGCSAIPTEALLSLAAQTASLLVLDLNHCKKCGDEVVAAFAARNASLRCVNLASCRRLTDEAMTSLAASRCSAALTHLNLNNLPRLTDRGLAALFGSAPLRRSVSLRGNRGVTDIAVTAAALGCPLLEGACLSGCEKVSDIGVMQMAFSLPLLSHLDLSQCKRISDHSLHALGNGCPQLRALRLHVDLSNAGSRNDGGGISEAMVVNIATQIAKHTGCSVAKAISAVLGDCSAPEHWPFDSM